MRIWHEKLIPKLCKNHILGLWREGLGAYAIITGKVDGGSYKNHPAVKEFENCPDVLHNRLNLVRQEMLKRGYHPKPLPECWILKGTMTNNTYFPNQPKEWQSLTKQIEVLKSKKCKCKLE